MQYEIEYCAKCCKNHANDCINCKDCKKCHTNDILYCYECGKCHRHTDDIYHSTYDIKCYSLLRRH